MTSPSAPVCATCDGSQLIEYDDAFGEPRNAPCPDCSQGAPCEKCGGSGYINPGDMRTMRSCPYCNGTGRAQGAQGERPETLRLAEEANKRVFTGDVAAAGVDFIMNCQLGEGPSRSDTGGVRRWHAEEIFRRDWTVEGGVARGEIVEWKRGKQFSSNHSEAFIDVVLAADYDALAHERNSFKEQRDYHERRFNEFYDIYDAKARECEELRKERDYAIEMRNGYRKAGNELVAEKEAALERAMKCISDLLPAAQLVWARNPGTTGPVGRAIHAGEEFLRDHEAKPREGV